MPVRRSKARSGVRAVNPGVTVAGGTIAAVAAIATGRVVIAADVDRSGSAIRLRRHGPVKVVVGRTRAAALDAGAMAADVPTAEAIAATVRTAIVIATPTGGRR